MLLVLSYYLMKALFVRLNQGAIIEMIKHDRHIKNGQKEKVYDEMIK